MRGLIVLIICSMVSLVTAKIINDAYTESQQEYCARLRDGKLIMMEGEIELTSDVTLENGILIKMDGTVVKLDGSQLLLKEGECVDKEGKTVEPKRKENTVSRKRESK